MAREIKAKDCTTGYKKTLLRYKAAILDDQGAVIWTSKKRYKTAKLAKEVADRTLSINAVIAVKQSEDEPAK